jgi:hypothetical protein
MYTTKVSNNRRWLVENTLKSSKGICSKGDEKRYGGEIRALMLLVVM